MPIPPLPRGRVTQRLTFLQSFKQLNNRHSCSYRRCRRNSIHPRSCGTLAVRIGELWARLLLLLLLSNIVAVAILVAANTTTTTTTSHYTIAPRTQIRRCLNKEHVVIGGGRLTATAGVSVARTPRM